MYEQGLLMIEAVAGDRHALTALHLRFLRAADASTRLGLNAEQQAELRLLTALSLAAAHGQPINL